VHIALFITHLLDSGATHNTINSIIYSIKWVHGMCNKNDPTNNSYIVSLQESAKRAVLVPITILVGLTFANKKK
jgi:hypothetical protein